MSSKLQLDVSYLSLRWRHLVNAYEGSMSDRFEIYTVYKRRYINTLLFFSLLLTALIGSTHMYIYNTNQCRIRISRQPPCSQLWERERCQTVHRLPLNKICPSFPQFYTLHEILRKFDIESL